MMRTARLALALLASAALLSGCGVVLPAGGALAVLLAGKKSGSGGVVVIRSQDTNVVLARGAFDLGDSNEGRARTIVATQLDLTATKAATLRALTFELAGTGAVAALPVRLHIDTDRDGALGSQDTQLGAKTASGGRVTFSDLALSLAEGATTTFLVVLDTPADAKDGDTFQVTVTSIDSVDAQVTNSAGATEQANVLGVPYSGGVKTISPTGSLRLFNGPNTPKSKSVFTNTPGVPVLQIELRASSVEGIQLQSLALKTSGTGDDAASVRGALYVDGDGDGLVDAGDLPLASGAAAPTDEGTLTFAGLGVTLAAGEIVRLLVVYDFTGAALDGQTFRVDLPAASSVTALGVTSANPIAPTGTPLTGGATLTVTRATLALAAGPINPNQGASPSATNVAVLQLTLAAGPAEPVTVSSLQVQSTGSGHEPTGLAAVRLAVDANGDGRLDAGDTVFAGPLTYAVDDGAVVFSNLPRTIAAGGSETWLVLVDVASVASGGGRFTAKVGGPGAVVAVGQGSGLPVAATVPALSGGTLTVTGSLALGPGPNPPPAQTPFANAPNVAVLQARATAGAGEAIRVTSVTVRPSGTGDDKNAIATVELYRDADGSGTVSAGDTLLASGTFANDDTPLAFSNPAGLIPGDIPAGGTADLLVRYVLSGQAGSGQTFVASTGPVDVTAQGVASGLAVPVGGATQASSTITAQRATLTVAPGPQNPGASNVLPGAANVSLLQLQVVTGGAEPVSISSIGFRASGTANDATAVSSVAFYLEGAGPAGVLDGSDTALGTAQSYATDDGTVTFTIAPALVLPASSTSQLLVVYQVSPTAAVGGTLVARLAAAADVTAVGATSGLGAAVTGTPVTGGAKTLIAPPASQVSLTSGVPQSGTAGAPLASPFVVTVRDASNNPVPGFTVTWAVTAGGGSLTATNTTTDALGRAQTTLTLGTVAGANQVQATAAGLSGSPVTFNATGMAGPAAQIVYTSGDGQMGTAGSAVASPFVITVRDTNGNPVTGAPVTFAVTAGGGSLTTLGTNTDGAGQASSTLTLGTVAGPNQATATATGLAGSPVTFNATGIAGAATQMALVSGDTQNAVAGTALVASFVVVVKDANGNPVPGVMVSWSVTAGTGALSVTTAPTSAAGLAASRLTLGTTAGTNGATASVAGLAGSPVAFTATGLAGPAAQIALSGGDGQSAIAGTTLSAPLAVTAKDANGNPVPGVLVTWNVTGGGGGLSAPTSTTDALGRAASRLTLGTAVGPNAATASVTGLAGSPVTFGATGTPGAATQVVLASGSGQNAPAGATLLAPFVVTVRDANGNAVPGFTVTWAVTGGGGSLSNLNTTTDGAGHASSTLTLGVAPGVNTVDATAAGLAGSPVTFSAMGTAGSTVTVVASPGVVIPAGPILPDDVERPMLQLRLSETSGTGGFDLSSLAIIATGSGDDATDVTAVKLWIDNPPLGVRDASDVLVGFSKYLVNDGKVTFGGLVVPTVPASGSLDLLVTYDMADATKVTVNETYQARLAGAGDITVASNPGAVPIVATGAFPLAGPTRTVTQTTLTVATGPASPTGTVNVRDGQMLVPVLQLALTAGASGPVTVTGLNLSAAGSANDATGVAMIHVYRDLDASGTLTAGDTLVVQSASPFPIDNGKAPLTGLSETIPAGTTVHWLVVYDLANTALANQTFQAFVATATDVIVASPGTVAGTFPVASPAARRTLNVVGGVTVALGPGNPAGTILAAPSNNDPVLELTVTADAAEAMNVSGLTITAAGTTNFGPGGSFNSVKLFQDRNLNHTLEPTGGSSDAPALDSLSSFTAGGKAAFTFAAVTIPAGTSVSFFVAVSVQGGPTPNGLFTARFEQNSELTATGVTTGSTLVSGATLAGEQFLVGDAAGLFSAATPVPLFITGQTVLHLAVADVNRDGKQDFVALRSGGKIEVHVGDGAGGFAAGPGGSPAGCWPVGAPPASPARLAIGDWNGDGYPDVIVAYATQLVVYLNDGAANPGAFSTSITTGVVAGASFADVKLVDYDRSGFIDIVATDAGANRLYGRRNDGAGGFTGTADTLATAGVPRRLVIADVNGDGLADVVYTEGGPNVVLATGTGTFFTTASTATVGGANMVDLAVVDVNRDGYPDVVAVDESANPNDKWRIFKSNAPVSATLTATASGSTSPGGITQRVPRDIVSGDWNGDGKTDTAIVHANPPGIVAYVGDGNGSFPPSSTSAYGLSAGTAPDRIAMGDFNRDGSPDLIAASSTVNDVAFLFAAGGGFTGGGSGAFGNAAQDPWGLTPTPRSVTIADFDHDGALDFAVAARENAFAVWINNGKGKFTKRPDVLLAGSPERIVSGDFDRDGLPDVAVSIGGGMDRVEVHLSLGGGAFAAPVVAFCLTASSPTALAVGDVDRDGDLDVACVESGTSTVQVFRGDGTALGDALPADRYPTGAGPVDVKLADVNGDGKLDLVVLCRTARTIEVRLGDGTGSFGAALVTSLAPALGAASALALGDVDRDGVLDCVVASADSNAIELLKGSGAGTFASQGTIGAAGGAAPATDVALADTNKDGALDIVTSRAGGGVTAFVATGSFAFASGVTTPTAQGGLGVALALGDVNRDGKLDAVVPCDVTKDVQVLLGQ